MAAEWTTQISYDPALLSISVGPGKATYDNIVATQCFGITIADSEQNVLASIAGAYSGKTHDKVALLQALGFVFVPAQTMDVLLPQQGMLHAECRLVEQRVQGDHVVFVGTVEHLSADPSRSPLVYHRGKYWHVGEGIEKPSEAERSTMEETARAYTK